MTGIVHVVDDDEGIRESVQALLEIKGFESAAHGTVEGFLAAFKPESAICVLADLRMPGLGGLELQDKLAGQGIDVPVIMITGFGDVPSAVRALKSGAMDFIEKPLVPAVVLAAVERAAAARRDALAAAQAKTDAQQRLDALTPREREVLAHIVAGKSNKIIAYTLGISQRTVENHRARLMMKTRTDSVAELVKIALDVGLINGTMVDLHQGAAN